MSIDEAKLKTALKDGFAKVATATGHSVFEFFDKIDAAFHSDTEEEESGAEE